MGAAATPVARLESALAHAILPFDWYSNYCAHVDAGVANSATVQRYVGNPIKSKPAPDEGESQARHATGPESFQKPFANGSVGR
jgi:hypothetical protein